HRGRALDEGIDGYLGADRFEPSETLVAVDEAREALALGYEKREKVGLVVDRSAPRTLLDQVLCRAFESREWVLQVVGHLGRQPPEDGQPLGAVAVLRGRAPRLRE